MNSPCLIPLPSVKRKKLERKDNLQFRFFASMLVEFEFRFDWPVDRPSRNEKGKVRCMRG
jgi:hypothetical protein